MKKQYRLLGLILIIMLLTTGVSASLAQDDGPFSVAVVAPSATDDLAFSQSMYDALLVIQDEMGEDNFQFTFQDSTFVVDDAAVALQDWAFSGEYDLIIAHGSQYGSILEELAPQFPETAFAWGTDVNTFGLDNVYAYTVAAEEGGYINGVVAATLTQSNVIGVIGPIEVGDAKLYVDGFVHGAKVTNPDAEVNVVYIQSFSDVPLAREAAETHIANGADVLTGTAQMVVGPIAVAKEGGQYWFGTQSSQAELSGDVGVMFQVYHWEVVLRDMIANIQAGTLGGEAYTLTLENGGLAMEISPMAFGGDTVAQTLLQGMVDVLAGDIVSGNVMALP